MLDRRTFCFSLSALLTLRVASVAAEESDVVVRPAEYAGALRNPLKGLRSSDPASAKTLPYASLAKSYLKWNDLEAHAGDGVERIQAFCNAEWAGLAEINTKVIPRVYLDWPPGGHYWPADLPAGQYETPEFAQRVVALIAKLGQCWNRDPRVAYVETGIVGLWGEQHDPTPSLALQKVIGDAFVEYFPDKLLMNRYPGIFTDYKFGTYWDSFGHKEEMETHLPLLKSPRLVDRWKIAPMGGDRVRLGNALRKRPDRCLGEQL